MVFEPQTDWCCRRFWEHAWHGFAPLGAAPLSTLIGVNGVALRGCPDVDDVVSNCRAPFGTDFIDVWTLKKASSIQRCSFSMSFANPYRRRHQRPSPLAQEWVVKGVTRCTIFIIFPEDEPRFYNTTGWEIVEDELMVYIYLKYTRRLDPFITRTNIVTRLILAARTDATWSFEGWLIVSRIELTLNQ